MTRAIGYARVSTEEQAQNGDSLAAQRQAVADEVERRGWEQLASLEDAASGKSVRKRPGLAEALRRLEGGEADVLVVAKLDRLSRSVLDFANLTERARKRGWSLVVLDLGIDLTTPHGEMMAGLLAVLAQWERRVIGQRIRDVLALKKAQGVKLGRPRAIPDELRFRIRGMHRSGLTPTEIARWLNEEGVPTAHGGTRWYASTVRGIVS